MYQHKYRIYYCTVLINNNLCSHEIQSDERSDGQLFDGKQEEKIILTSKPQTTLVTFTQVTTAGGSVPTQALLVRPTITIPFANNKNVTTTYLTLLKPVDTTVTSNISLANNIATPQSGTLRSFILAYTASIYIQQTNSSINLYI